MVYSREYQQVCLAQWCDEKGAQVCRERLREGQKERKQIVETGFRSAVQNENNGSKKYKISL
jgi:hypothetical protein